MRGKEEPVPFGFGGRKASAVEVTVDRPEYEGGETVQATVAVGDLDDKVQGGRVELLYESTYRYEYTDSEGDRSQRRTTKDVIVASEPLFPVGEPGPAPGERTVAFELPETPPTAEGAVAWKVRAVVDRRRARDAQAEAPFEVRSRPEAHERWAQSGPSPVSGPLQFALEVAPRVLAPGDRLGGTVTVAAREDVEARALRVRLRSERREQDGIRDDDRHGEMTLEEPFRLAAGERRTHPFELEVPAGTAPSFQSAYNSQHWYVQAVADRRMRGDHQCSVELAVYSAAPARV
jgi:hypothetical protein